MRTEPVTPFDLPILPRNFARAGFHTAESGHPRPRRALFISKKCGAAASPPAPPLPSLPCAMPLACVLACAACQDALSRPDRPEPAALVLRNARCLAGHVPAM